ncbi:MAG TPA: phosphoribosylamine--glycine ligase [bacterium]|nr:phosphoribosylamine--glycine ligase [bacterium]
MLDPACDIRNVLVVGSWAKEQITLENLNRYGQYNLYAYMDTSNPAVIRLVQDHAIGKFSNIQRIADFARDKEIDIALITAAAPLDAGLTDLLESRGITSFGPDRRAAQLEANKAFTRRLMKKYVPRAIPEFEVFSSAEDAVDYARQMDWKVAVKPLGLTDGLGVRVYGEQLENAEAIADYIHYIIDEAYSGHPEVIIEEKLEGEEFTLQCLVNDLSLVNTPSVQDFKKRLPGDRGVNTASMGSCSDTDHMLPFLGFADYQEAFRIMRETLQAFRKETGGICRGFLYGQFMITDQGVKLIEYNFRPGDPEWINVMFLLEEDLLNGVKAVLRGEETKLKFRRRATVCKYIVPPEYPMKLYQTLDVAFDEEELNRSGARVFFSCGQDSSERLQVGSERGLAFISESEKIYTAYKRVERTIRMVQGDFYHRRDIGTQAMVRRKIRHIEKVRKVRVQEPVFQRASEADFLEVFDMVSKMPPLEPYQPHLFKIILRYFQNTCFVARCGDRLVGWVMGFRDQTNPETYFLWQIGILPAMQGSGLGTSLMKYVVKEMAEAGAGRIEATIDPENTASQKLFEKQGYRNISRCIGETASLCGNQAVIDYYGPGRHFMVYEKILQETK